MSIDLLMSIVKYKFLLDFGRNTNLHSNVSVDESNGLVHVITEKVYESP